MFLSKDFKAEIGRLETQKRRDALERVRANTPVKTGAAQRSWRIQGHEVVSDSEYMAKLNNGHSEQAPSRFIERAILEDSTLRPNGSILVTR